MKSKIFHLKRQAISQNFVLGIDPGKEKHSGSVLNPSGLQQGGTFSFPVTRAGYDHNLWQHLERRIKDCGPTSAGLRSWLRCKPSLGHTNNNK